MHGLGWQFWPFDISFNPLISALFEKYHSQCNKSGELTTQASHCVVDCLHLNSKFCSWHRPFLSSPQPPFQSEVKCEVFVMKISFHSY